MSSLLLIGSRSSLALLIIAIVFAAGCLGSGPGDDRDNIDQPPVPSFTLSADKVRVGNVLTVDPTQSRDIDGFLVSYVWDFGDGSDQVTETDALVQEHTFTSVGQFAVTLTVEDNDGQTTTALKWVEILATLPAGVEVNIVTKTNDIFDHRPGAGTSHNITDGGSTQYLILVKNTGDETDTFTLTSDALEPWSATFEPAVLEDVAPGYQVYSVVTVTGSLEDTSLGFTATSANNASVSAAARATTHIVAAFGDTVPSAWTAAQIDYNLINIGGDGGVTEDGWIWNQGANFRGSNGGLIDGFNEAIPGMQVGQTKVVVVPPEKAYTSPSHDLFEQTLIFEITIVEIL